MSDEILNNIHNTGNSARGFDNDGFHQRSVGDLVPDDINHLAAPAANPALGGAAAVAAGAKNVVTSDQPIQNFAQLSESIQTKLGPWRNQRFLCEQTKSTGEIHLKRCIQFQSKSLKKLYIFLKCFDSNYSVKYGNFWNSTKVMVYFGRSLAKEEYIKAGLKKKSQKEQFTKVAILAFKHSENVLEAFGQAGPVGAGVAVAVLPMWLIGKGIIDRQHNYKYWVRIFPSVCEDQMSNHGLVKVGESDSFVNTRTIADAFGAVFDDGSYKRQILLNKGL
jgi:hypothetical protein